MISLTLHLYICRRWTSCTCTHKLCLCNLQLLSNVLHLSSHWIPVDLQYTVQGNSSLQSNLEEPWEQKQAKTPVSKQRLQTMQINSQKISFRVMIWNYWNIHSRKSPSAHDKWKTKTPIHTMQPEESIATLDWKYILWVCSGCCEHGWHTWEYSASLQHLNLLDSHKLHGPLKKI